MLHHKLVITKTGTHTNASILALEKLPNHKLYADYIKNKQIPIVIGVGPARCGKTLSPCAHAINNLLSKDISKIVLTRPAVTMDEEHGFLPGDLESKMMPWLIPIYDCFKEYITNQRLKEFLHNEDIEICPLSYIRGRTFNNPWIIADEVQNTTINQKKTLLTRIGHNSKMILTGDLQQCDIVGQNGLDDFLKRLDNVVPNDNFLKVVQFDENDIMRSEVVKYVLDV